MQDLIDFARKNGVVLLHEGRCQFCGSNVSKGVLECHENVLSIAELLDFSNPVYYRTRFLSVDAMTLQHCEIHGPWNNHIHFTRLFLIFEKGVKWDYSKTPLLSNVINQYKKNKSDLLEPPPPKQRGRITTTDLLTVTTIAKCMQIVERWAKEVYKSYEIHIPQCSTIAEIFLKKYYS